MQLLQLPHRKHSKSFLVERSNLANNSRTISYLRYVPTAAATKIGIPMYKAFILGWKMTVVSCLDGVLPKIEEISNDDTYTISFL